MRINLKLSHKGLILVSILLALELMFVAGLASLLNQAEQAIQRENHSKEIVGKTNHIFQLLYEAGTAASDYQMRDGGPQAANRYWNASGQILGRIDELKKLVADNPRYVAIVEHSQENANNAIKLVSYCIKLSEKGHKMEALLAAAKAKPIFDKSQAGVLEDLKEFMEEQETIIKESPAEQTRHRDHVKQLLLGGVVCNILVAVALALIFVRGITTRIDAVVANTNRLARGQSLSPVLPGTDEIAHLDQVFHEMADALAEAARLKQQFVAMISHDLRTPLTSIKGFLQLLSDGVYGDLSEQGVKRSELAERNVGRLISLINDLLDIEKMEAGKLDMHFETIELGPVLEKSIESVRTFAEQHGVTLEFPSVSKEIYADGDRLIRVLVNLISNAVKFSPQASAVTLEVRESPEYTEIRVVDRGRGIPKHMHEAVFERFRQVEAADAKQKGGTGLGLAICKAIVEQHGGLIGVDSEEGKGSTFWFRIPVKTDVPATAASPTGAGTEAAV